MVFAIEAMGTRVAEVSLSPEGPRLLLADHLDGEAPVLLHRDLGRPGRDARRARGARIAGGAERGAAAGPRA